jgi:amidase
MMGYAPLNHGNDIGGSLRFPAAACGAATVKPGLGRTPAYNPSAPLERGMLAQLMSVQGVIAREVRDVRLGMRALLRYDPHDPWMVPMPFDGEPCDGPITVGFTKETFEFDLHPAVSDALDAARQALVDAGYVVREVDPPLLRESAEAAGRCLFGETILMLGGEIEKHGSDTLKRIFADYESAFSPLAGDDLMRAMAERAKYVRAWTTFLDETPLMLTPFMLQPTFAWDRDAQGPDGVREVLHSAIYSYAMNFLGLPAGNVPAAYTDGLPIGVQIVGRRFREDMILDALEAIESRVGVMAPRLWAREAEA